MSALSERIPLTEAVRELRQRSSAVTYATLWRAVAQGDVPAERTGGRWFVNRADLSRIVQTLGIPTASAA
jgi:hypothetical protein